MRLWREEQALRVEGFLVGNIVIVEVVDTIVEGIMVLVQVAKKPIYGDLVSKLLFLRYLINNNINV